MKIEHIAIWTENLDLLKDFYVKYLEGKSNQKYREEDGFESYFITFESGARLELMRRPPIIPKQNIYDNFSGFTHLAFSVCSREKVDSLTNQLKSDGYEILNNPRVTGDGYYESSFFDPDGNIIEITA